MFRINGAIVSASHGTTIVRRVLSQAVGAPGRRFWRRSDLSERRAGLNPIAALWGEGSPSSGGSEQVSNGGPAQHGG